MHAERRGTPAGQNLRSGAQIAVSVRETTITVIVSRPGKPLSATRADHVPHRCRIPIGAEHAPAEGQEVREIEGTTWHRVAWRWPR